MRLPPNSSDAPLARYHELRRRIAATRSSSSFKWNGFGEVVVAAGLEAAHAVLGGALHRQEQHGRLDAVAAKLRAELEPVHVRHHDVEDDEVERLGSQALEPRHPVVRDVGAVALGFEVLADARREMLLVVDDENTGRRLHCAASGRPTHRYGGTVTQTGAFRVHGSTRELDQALHDVEPEARSRRRAAQLVAEPMKLLEDHGRILGREAQAVVADGEHDAAGIALAFDADRAALGGDARLQRVVEQITQPGFDDDGIDVQREVFRHRARHRDSARLRTVGDRCDGHGRRPRRDS